MKHLLLLIIIFTATSCQYFETEKLSTQTLVEEELKTIDWKDVDQYPAFSACTSYTEKEAQKNCFTNTLTSHLYQSINQRNIVVHHDVKDTIKLSLEVDTTGRLQLTTVAMDSIMSADFPQLKQWLLESIDSLQPVAPAYKRGIPVKTQFTLPVIIQTQHAIN